MVTWLRSLRNDYAKTAILSLEYEGTFQTSLPREDLKNQQKLLCRPLDNRKVDAQRQPKVKTRLRQIIRIINYKARKREQK